MKENLLAVGAIEKTGTTGRFYVLKDIKYNEPPHAPSRYQLCPVCSLSLLLPVFGATREGHLKKMVLMSDTNIKKSTGKTILHLIFTTNGIKNIPIDKKPVKQMEIKYEPNGD